MVEKNRYVKNFKLLWYVDVGEDYTSQSQSEFVWYDPHLYNYCCAAWFYSNVVFIKISDHFSRIILTAEFHKIHAL